MARVCKIGEYIEGKEEFTCYVERLEQYFAANEVAEDKKVAVFLAIVGPQTYSLLRNILTPDLPSTKSYDELVKSLKDYFTPKPLVISERFKFHTRNQKEGESISDYIVALKKLATDCEFGQFLSEALRDRLVCGLRSGVIQKKLLAEKDLTLKSANEIALAMEMAARNTTEMNPQSVQVNKVSGSKFKKFNPTKGDGASKNKRNNQAQVQSVCFRCDGKHAPDKCKFKTAKCFKCSKVGHIAKKCAKNRDVQNKSLEHYEVQDFNQSDGDLGLYGVRMHRTSSSTEKPPAYTVNIQLNGKSIKMEIDTGAAVSVISESVYRKHFKHLPLGKSQVTLKTYCNEKVDILGQLKVNVQYGCQSAQLTVFVVKGNRPCLMGRDWLKELRLDWADIFRVHLGHTSLSVKELISRYNGLFDKSVGTIKNFNAQIRIKSESQPRFCKARPVPFALREPLEKELQRLESEGIISKVETSDWATPIVVVPKSDNSIRLCGDFKVTVNQCLDEQQYPLPNIEDMFAQLAGGKKFTKLDLSQAYQQLTLDKDSQRYLTINTHLGLFQYHRLPFGVSSAPAIFQSVMDQILVGLPKVLCRIDDILITGSTDEEHLCTLREVFDRLEKHDIRLRKDKCKFMAPDVEYMGHMINEEGVHPTNTKVEALQKFPSPTNVSELKSFLGLLNYYGPFLPILSTTLQPLYQLLQKNQTWKWTKDCETVFQSCKKQLSESTLLVHYDSKKPLKLACDASAYGLGAVISHVLDNGEERPIAFASRTLSPSEKNYAQLEKEALSLIFGVKKFHKYLYGRKFTLVTDHKPLTTILGPKTGVPTLAAARLQRWALILSAYQYDIVYRKSAEHSNADTLSRLPVQDPVHSDEAEIYHFSYVNDLPVIAKDISEATRKDPVLCRVLDYMLNGWPNQIDDSNLQPYFQRRTELSTETGCILWGLRVIIPKVYRERLLNVLHEQHLGIVKMKSLARSYLWWPKLDQDIETLAKACSVCQTVRSVPSVAPLHSWPWTTRVWQRIHVDFAEKDKNYFLVLIDSHSKWIEVFHMNTTTSTHTINVLRSVFASYGLPEEIVSDNGPQFSSHEFQEFVVKNGIKHTLVPAYHPASNGAAERSVQILKQTLLKQVLDGHNQLSMQHRLANFLIQYRSTPHTVTGVSPAELFLKRQIRTKLTLLKPTLEKRVKTQQETQKQFHDKGRTKVRTFQPKEAVRVRNFRGGKEKWILGTVIKSLGPLTYLVRVGPSVRYVHVDHLLSTSEDLQPDIIQNDDLLDNERVNSSSVPLPIVNSDTSFRKDIISSSEDVQEPTSINENTAVIPICSSENSDVQIPNSATPSDVNLPRRNPSRNRKPPEKLNL